MAILRTDQLVRQVRKKLDELPAEENFWSNEELLDYLNEGLAEVWQTVREAQRDWFVKTIRSTDSPLTITSREYDPALLTVLAGRDSNLLPPDFDQLVLLEEIPPTLAQELSPSGSTRRGATFIFTQLADTNFRERFGEPGLLEGLVYFVHIERRHEGAFLVFAPAPRVSASIPVVLKYIAQAPTLTLKDTFETAAVTEPMIAAVRAFMKYMAVSKLEDNDFVVRAAGEWERKRLLTLRSAGPNQARDPEHVIGWMENELLEDWS